MAAGLGARFGGDKLFVTVAGRPVLAHTLAAFEACLEVAEIALVLGEANQAAGKELVVRFGFTKVSQFRVGGSRRQDSVLAGLLALDQCEWVAVHDGARPLVSPAMIARGLAAAQRTGAAVPGIPVKDTIKIVDGLERVLATPARVSLRAIQTPQVFRRRLLLAAYAGATAEVTDDASLLEALGHLVIVFPGEPANLKITTVEDLEIAEAWLRRGGGGN